MLAPFARQLVRDYFHTGIYVFKASKYLVYLWTDQKAERKTFLDQLPEKSQTRFSWDISGQSVPVILYCGFFLLKYGLNDMMNEKIKSSQFQQHWFLSCCAIYLKSSMDFYHPLCFRGHCFETGKTKQRAIVFGRNVVRGTRFQFQIGLEPDIYSDLTIFLLTMGLPWWLSGKESACNAGDPGSIPGLGRSPGKGNSNPLQYSCLGNTMERRVWQAVQSMGWQRVGHNLAIKQLRGALTLSHTNTANLKNTG